MEKEKKELQKKKFRLRKLLSELSKYRARHTELITVYIPAGYQMQNIINQLAVEAGTARNIKSATTRKYVTAALEKMIQHLRSYKKTPENGLAVFAGNISEREGVMDMKDWSIEPPEPINVKLYRCDQTFFLDPLKEMLEIKSSYGLIVMDRREADIALLRGKNIQSLISLSSMVPGKFKVGGQCLAEDTLVQLSDGRIATIGSVGSLVKCVDFRSYRLTDTHTIDKWSKDEEIAYKIITKSPRNEIICSKDHLFFVREDKIVEKAAEELETGDYLVMPEKLDLDVKIRLLDVQDCYEYKILNSGRKLIEAQRKKLGLSQKQLAHKLKTYQATISAVESGKINLIYSNLNALCEELKTDFNAFVEKHTRPTSEVRLPTELGQQLAQIAGYYLGDGNLEEARLRFSEHREGVANYYLEKARQLFNANGSLKYRENKGYHQISVYGRPIEKLFKKYFPKNGVPEVILKSPNSIVAAFLKGFSDAEGYVSSRVALGINDKLLAKQIQLLLLRFGILSSFQEYDSRRNPYSKKHRFTIELCGKESHILFKDLIGFTAKDKAEKLNRLVQKKSYTDYTRQILPRGSVIRKVIEKYGIKINSLGQVANSGFFRNNRELSKVAFKRTVIDKVKNKELKAELEKIYNYPLIPVKINKIEKIEFSRPLIDISTKAENFIANGLVVHNSAARMARVIEGMAKDWYKKVGDAANQIFSQQKVKAIILGGPGPTKDEFLSGNFIQTEIKKKIVAVKAIGYTGDFGLKELVEKSEDVLSEEEVSEETQTMQRFLQQLASRPNMVAYGEPKVQLALGQRAVEILLVSESLEDQKMFDYIERAGESGAEVILISTDTKEGQQLTGLGAIAAILRYAI